MFCQNMFVKEIAKMRDEIEFIKNLRFSPYFFTFKSI